MRLHVLNPRNRAWKLFGGGILLACVGASAWLLYLGPRPLKPKQGGKALDHGAEGRLGNITQQLGSGRFVLHFETIQGDKDDLRLQGVQGDLEEPGRTWLMQAPSARRTDEVWFLDGPLNLEARALQPQASQGKGVIRSQTGPALKWDHGVWTGLGTLDWDDLSGPGKGHWLLPPGWRRDLNGTFVVEQGPVHWTAGAPGVLRSLQADRMQVTLGFQQGRLEGIDALLEGGRFQAKAGEMDATNVRWLPPIRFARNDGWRGQAEAGEAPRPVEGQGLERVDFKHFKAERAVPGGSDDLQADGVRWTPAGLRLEGNVRWGQPLDGERLRLQAPRVLIREQPGPDLPADLPPGEACAEGYAVLSWGSRSLSSPRIDVHRAQRTWRIHAPTLGRGELGTFSAGQGTGNPTRWTFDGPIRATLTAAGGTLRGDRLLWENKTWTLQGHPATWNGVRQRLSGTCIIRLQDKLQFPEGLTGALAMAEGDLTVRADRGEGSTNQIQLTGRVECQGPDWRLRTDRLVVELVGGVVRSISARGSVALQGSMGEGRGDVLDLDLKNFHARWRGKVDGVAKVEVRP